MKDNTQPDAPVVDFEEMDLFADELDERYNAGTVSSSTCVSSASSATSSASCACCFSCLCTGSVADPIMTR
jgi:hypothetical protein